MGNLTRISGSFVIPKSFHGKDLNITGSTEFSASNFSITASEGVHITGSTVVSGGNLTLVGSTFSASQAQHPDSATGSVEYVKYVHTGSFASGSDIQIIRAESASYVVSTNTGSYASGSDFQASTTLGNGIASIHRRTGSLELSSSYFRISASEGIHVTGSMSVSGGLLTVENLTVSGGSTTPATSSELYVKQADTGSFASGSDIQIIKAESASYVVSTNTGSYLQNADTASFATLKVTGDITTSGSVFAREFHTEFTSASITYASGSTKFGDDTGDLHRFSGSIEISASRVEMSASEGVHMSASLFVTGSVGIGTTGPDKALEVVGDIHIVGDDGWDGAGDLAIVQLGGDDGYGIGYKYGTGMIFNVYKSSGGGSFGTDTYDAITILDGASAGNVGIGTTSPARPLTVSSDGEVKALFENTSTTGGQYAYIDVESNATSTAKAYLRLITPDGTSTIHSEGTATAVTLKDGKVGIGIAVPTQKLHVFDDSTLTVLNLTNDHESHPQGIQLGFSSASPNNNTQEAFKFSDNVNNRCIIWSNGDIDNTGNSYSAFSDERIKNSITDASSQWDDIKAIKVRKFKKNSDVLQYGEDAPIHIGVVAQEVESAGMSGLVFEHPADEIEIANNEDISEGDMVKSVKYSILYMKAIKALQEAMTKIETLESRVTALENA